MALPACARRYAGRRRRRVGGFGGTSLAAGTGRSFPGKDAGSPRIDVRYGGDRGRSLGSSGAPPAAQLMCRQSLLAKPAARNKLRDDSSLGSRARHGMRPDLGPAPAVKPPLQRYHRRGWDCSSAKRRSRTLFAATSRGSEFRPSGCVRPSTRSTTARGAGSSNRSSAWPVRHRPGRSWRLWAWNRSFAVRSTGRSHQANRRSGWDR
jgi:hypothetical protein